MLTSARDHYARQQRLTAAALVRIRSAKTPADVAQIVAAFQVLAARDAAESVPLMLAEQGIDPDPQGRVVPDATAGTASDGRPLESLFAQASDDRALALMAVTQVQDIARMAASVAMVSSYGAQGYVRMLNPPSCSRCAVLAGRFYRWNDGFQRHPKCDCRHIPSRENLAGDLTTSPSAYFERLPTTTELEARYPLLTRRMRNEAWIYSREDIFGVSGSKAILDGADISQVVNARRGMALAQVSRRDVLISLEGTTKRGLASRARTGRNMSTRLMPESIYAIARDRDDALRMLRLHGYLI